MPFILTCNRPEVKSIKDFKEGDKIAVPGIKNSNQAICLQMRPRRNGDRRNMRGSIRSPSRAASGRSRRDHLEVDRAGRHYASRRSRITNSRRPGVHAVLKSYDTLGGQTTNGVMFMARKFRDTNPKITGAVYAALAEASDLSTRSRARAPKSTSA